MSKTVELLLLSKPGCHLCDDARAVVSQVRTELASRGIDTMLSERNILEDPALARLYAEDIPVLFVAGKQHAIWRVDAQKLTRAIERAVGWRGIFARNA